MYKSDSNYIQSISYLQQSQLDTFERLNCEQRLVQTRELRYISDLYILESINIDINLKKILATISIVFSRNLLSIVFKSIVYIVYKKSFTIIILNLFDLLFANQLQEHDNQDYICFK